jgi:putative transposase
MFLVNQCLKRNSFTISVVGCRPRLRTHTSHYEAHYHEERNHQGKNNVLLFPLPTQAVRGERAKVRCRERLGGLLKYYEREAA